MDLDFSCSTLLPKEDLCSYTNFKNYEEFLKETTSNIISFYEEVLKEKEKEIEDIKGFISYEKELLKNNK